jgi:hypothetical protein
LNPTATTKTATLRQIHNQLHPRILCFPIIL